MTHAEDDLPANESNGKEGDMASPDAPEVDGSGGVDETAAGLEAMKRALQPPKIDVAGLEAMRKALQPPKIDVAGLEAMKKALRSPRLSSVAATTLTLALAQAVAAVGRQGATLRPCSSSSETIAS